MSTHHRPAPPSANAQGAPTRSRKGRHLAEDPVARPLQFAIPLKQQDKPVKFPDNFRKTIKYEYAVRYLEKMGASPTPENIKMVGQNMPIEKCKVNAAWKSRGWIADTYYVIPHPKKQPVDASGGSPSPYNDGLNKSSRLAVPSSSESRLGGQHYSSSKSAEGRGSERTKISAYGDPKPEGVHRAHGDRTGADVRQVNGDMNFEAFKKKHVFPYNRRQQLVVQNSAILPSLSLKVPSKALQLEREDQANAATIGCMATRRRMQMTRENRDAPGRSPLKVMMADHEANPNGGSAYSTQKMSDESNFSGSGHGIIRRPGGMNSSADIRDESILMSEELGRPLQMTVSDITEIQAGFVKALPKDLLRKKLTEEQDHVLANLLMSPDMKRLTGLVSHYVFWTVFQTIVLEMTKQLYDEGLISKQIQIPQLQTENGLSEADRQRVYLTMTDTFSNVKNKFYGQNAQLFQIPVMLLSLRVAVEAIYTKSYPAWFSLKDDVDQTTCGDLTMMYINDAITQLFDPNQFYSHISPVESTIEAIRVSQKAQHRMTRKQNDSLRDKFYTTSSTIQSIYPRPSAGNSTRILQQNGGALAGKKSSQSTVCPWWKSQALLSAVSGEHAGSITTAAEGSASSQTSRLSATNRTKLLEMALKNAQNKYSNSRDQRLAARGEILGGGAPSSPRAELSKQKKKSIANKLSIGRATQMSVS